MIKLLKKIINCLFKTKLTTTQFHFLREIYRRRRCIHCDFFITHINRWCSNNDANKVRGTNIPSVCHCPYWKPDKKFIRQKLRK